eukprot:TRINITY_DN7276_c0_g1_i1.p1 TRINITY_DN7276_c0_g1~~TRINITY_DN7276_c0_g1_i1.p1  ORF type:complete len:440 (-),score=114.67 TRINITY_DN7276_c0_g1_i1:452-1708(-)
MASCRRCSCRQSTCSICAAVPRSDFSKTPEECAEAARRFRTWLISEHSLPLQSAKDYSEAFRALLENQGRTEGVHEKWLGILMNATEFLHSFVKLPEFQKLGNNTPTKERHSHRRARAPSCSRSGGSSSSRGATATTPKPKQARSLSASADSAEEGVGEDALTPEALQQAARPLQQGAAAAEAKKQRQGLSPQAARRRRSAIDSEGSDDVDGFFGAFRAATAEMVDAARARQTELETAISTAEAALLDQKRARTVAREAFVQDNLALQAARLRLDDDEKGRTASSSSSAPPEASTAKVQSKLSFAGKQGGQSIAAAAAAAATPQRSRSRSSGALATLSVAEALKAARAKQAASAAAVREADLDVLVAEAALHEAADAAREAFRELRQREALLAGKSLVALAAAAASSESACSGSKAGD